MHSFVANAVKAPEYNQKPPIATYYYSYYSGFDADDIELIGAPEFARSMQQWLGLSPFAKEKSRVAA